MLDLEKLNLAVFCGLLKFYLNKKKMPNAKKQRQQKKWSIFVHVWLDRPKFLNGVWHSNSLQQSDLYSSHFKRTLCFSFRTRKKGSPECDAHLTLLTSRSWRARLCACVRPCFLRTSLWVQGHDAPWESWICTEYCQLSKKWSSG